MEAMQRALQARLRAEDKAQSSTGPTEEEFTMEDAEDRTERMEMAWKRIALRLMMAIRAAIIQETLVALTDLPGRRPPEGSSQNEEVRARVRRVELLMRPQLPRSKSIKFTWKEQEDCRHPSIVALEERISGSHARDAERDGQGRRTRS